MEQTKREGKLPSAGGGDNSGSNGELDRGEEKQATRDGSEGSSKPIAAASVPGVRISEPTGSQRMGQIKYLGHCAVIMLADDYIFHRSRITTEHQARLTAAQWRGGYGRIGTQAVYGLTPEVL